VIEVGKYQVTLVTTRGNVTRTRPLRKVSGSKLVLLRLILLIALLSKPDDYLVCKMYVSSGFNGKQARTDRSCCHIYGVT